MLADETERDWLQRHRPDSERLLDIDEELRKRKQIERAADRNLQRLHHRPEPLTPPIEMPPPDIDIDMDMGR